MLGSRTRCAETDNKTKEMSTIDELLDSILGHKRPTFYPEFANRVRSSRRFRAFAVTYQTKIRAKLKRVPDEESMQDLRAELETAALLLDDARFTLEYEKYAASKQRGPDFTVTFKTHTPFNVEVRRIRRAEWDGADPDSRTFKLVTVICEKLGQLPPSIVNLLWLASEHAISLEDLTRAVTTLRQFGDSQDTAFLTRRGFQNTADFYKHFRRLSGIILHQPNENGVWLNPLAKHKPLPEIVTTIQRLKRD